MKIKIRPSTKQPNKPLAEDLLVEPDPNDPEGYIRVSKALWDSLMEIASNLLTEENDDVKAYCNKHDYYQLKDILIKLNALSMASKGNLLKGKK
jgi:hypothetical protein